MRTATAAARLARVGDRVIGVELADESVPWRTSSSVPTGAARWSRVTLKPRTSNATPAAVRSSTATCVVLPHPGRDPRWPWFSQLGDELAYVFPSDAGLTCIAISINLKEYEGFRHERGLVSTPCCDGTTACGIAMRRAVRRGGCSGAGPNRTTCGAVRDRAGRSSGTPACTRTRGPAPAWTARPALLPSWSKPATGPPGLTTGWNVSPPPRREAARRFPRDRQRGCGPLGHRWLSRTTAACYSTVPAAPRPARPRAIAHRSAEMEALDAVAAERPQRLDLCGRSTPSATTSSRSVWPIATIDLGHRRVVPVEAQVVDERLVDLDHVDGQVLQIAQRRVARAEVVDGDPDTRAPAAPGAPRRSRRPGASARLR